MKLLRPCLIAAALAGFMISALANSVTLINGTPEAGAMTVVYKIAHKNPGQATVLGTAQTLKLVNNAVIAVSLNGYSAAGIIPVSVNGHILPDNVNQFGIASQCAVATDLTHTTGQMTFTSQDHPKSLSCSVSSNMTE